MKAVCRFCEAPLTHVFVDLGTAPLSNSFLTEDQLAEPEAFYPLRVYVCDSCFLVQLPVHESPKTIFTEYAYFSSFSETWLQHVEAFAIDAVSRFRLGQRSRVIEVASNDGCLLAAFKARGIAILGIEPATNVARHAEAAGVPTVVDFFSSELANRLASGGERADLLVANNVLAQVPDLNDFVRGLKIILARDGVLSIEVPHLLKLMAFTEFDTIYHEHFSYFSFTTLHHILERHGLMVFDVEELAVHGGSLRVLARHADDAAAPKSERVAALLQREASSGYLTLEACVQFAKRTALLKREIIKFLIKAQDEGQHVAAYGAPAKGNTLLNYCGIRSDLIEYTIDRNPHKQGLFLPGSRLRVYPPAHLASSRPDLVLILPWNLRNEIARQLSDVRAWGGRLAVAIPNVQIVQ